MHRAAFPVIMMAAAAVSLTACGKKDLKKKAARQVKALKACKSSYDCTKPNRCVKYAKGKGLCVQRCHQDDECPSPFLCTGSYQWMKYGTIKVGKEKKFCRPANRDEGQTCIDVKHGCKKDMSCVAGRCRKRCHEAKDCPDDRTCITYEKREKVCLVATLPEGKPCTVKGMTRCKRGLRCYAKRCVRPCWKDRPCPAGAVCTGEAFTGRMASLDRKLGKPKWLYCERKRDAKKEALASRKCKNHRNCASPNHCVKFGKAGSFCHYPCAQHADCPKSQRCTGVYTKGYYPNKKRIRFCRKGANTLGDPCGGRAGCGPKLRCYGSKCLPECAAGKDCKQDAKCIRIVYGIKLPGKRRPTAYRVCLAATLDEGAACKDGKVPHCKRGLRCHKKKCVRTCKKAADCSGGKACKGKHYGFTKKGFKPTYLFCE